VLQEREHINLVFRVNKEHIRYEDYNGRPHLVISSKTLPDNVVMNDGLYTKEEIDKAYAGLEGTFAPLGHPVVNGEFVSAMTPEAVNAHHIGAWNRNVKRDGNRVDVEKWVDIEFASNLEQGRAFLSAVEKGDPIHTSTGIFLQREPVANAKGYKWIARNMLMDHDAILLGEVGAATPAEGVGLMVNVADAKPLAVNEPGKPVLSADSYRAQAERLERAARERFGNGNTYVWVPDFDATTAIVETEGGKRDAYSYSIVDGAVKWADDSTPVESKQTWTTVNALLQRLGFKVNSNPSNPDPGPEADQMDPKELAAALEKNQNATLAAVGDLLKPLTEGIAGLQANQAKLEETLTANTRAAETEKRAVVAKAMGDDIANSLTGNALDQMVAKLKGGTPGLGGALEGNTEQPYKMELPE